MMNPIHKSREVKLIILPLISCMAVTLIISTSSLGYASTNNGNNNNSTTMTLPQLFSPTATAAARQSLRYSYPNSKYDCRWWSNPT
ncbi:MAG: hypothetical protein WBL44_14470 [Nitrososphaeraceae archaeon]